MKKIIVLLGILLSIVIPAQQAELNDKVYSILSFNNKTIIAGKIISGLYPKGTGQNIKSNVTSGYFDKPEYLVLADFLYKKNGDKTSILSLYDPMYREEADKRINISKTMDAFKNVVDFQLLSRQESDGIIRIRYNFIQDNGEKFPWVQYALNNKGKYFLITGLPQDYPFVMAASTHPNNKNDSSFTSPDVSGLFQISFKDIHFYLLLNHYSNTSTGNVREFITGMKNILISGSADDYKKLWYTGGREDLLKNGIFMQQYKRQKEFFSAVKEMIFAGFMNYDNEKAVFLRCILNDNKSADIIIPLIEIEGKIYLKNEFGTYYSSAIINNSGIKTAAVNYLLGK